MSVESCSPIVNEVWSWCERFCPRNSHTPARKSPPSWGDAARYSRRLSVTRSSRWVYSHTNSGTDPLLVMSPVWFPGLITLVRFCLLTVCEHRGRKPGSFYHVNDIIIDRAGAHQLKEHILCTHCSSETCIRFSTSQMFYKCTSCAWIDTARNGHSFSWGDSSPSLGRYWHDKMDQAFPLHVCIM